MLSHGPEVLRAIRSKAEKNKPAEKEKLFNGPNRFVWQKPALGCRPREAFRTSGRAGFSYRDLPHGKLNISISSTAMLLYII